MSRSPISQSKASRTEPKAMSCSSAAERHRGAAALEGGLSASCPLPPGFSFFDIPPLFPLTQPKMKGDPPAIDVPKSADAPQSNLTGLPLGLKQNIEQLAGMQLDDVRVHYNSQQPQKMDALAFTQGTQIHVGPGQEQHVPHEAWHVVQQKQGRVQPERQEFGMSINQNRGLESEADRMAQLAMSGSRLPAAPVPSAGIPNVSANAPVQYVKGLSPGTRVLVESKSKDESQPSWLGIILVVNSVAKSYEIRPLFGKENYVTVDEELVTKDTVTRNAHNVGEKQLEQAAKERQLRPRPKPAQNPVTVLDGHGVWTPRDGHVQVPRGSKLLYYSRLGTSLVNVQASKLLGLGGHEHVVEPEQSIPAFSYTEDIRLTPPDGLTITTLPEDEQHRVIHFGFDTDLDTNEKPLPVPRGGSASPKSEEQIRQESAEDQTREAKKDIIRSIGYIQIISTDDSGTSLSEFFRQAPALFEGRTLIWNACRIYQPRGSNPPRSGVQEHFQKAQKSKPTFLKLSDFEAFAKKHLKLKPYASEPPNVKQLSEYYEQLPLRNQSQQKPLFHESIHFDGKVDPPDYQDSETPWSYLYNVSLEKNDPLIAFKNVIKKHPMLDDSDQGWANALNELAPLFGRNPDTIKDYLFRLENLFDKKRVAKLLKLAPLYAFDEGAEPAEQPLRKAFKRIGKRYPDVPVDPKQIVALGSQNDDMKKLQSEMNVNEKGAKILFEAAKQYIELNNRRLLYFDSDQYKRYAKARMKKEEALRAKEEARQKELLERLYGDPSTWKDLVSITLD